MNRAPVASTDIASIGYDADTTVLEVEFLSGAIYQYQGVPEDLHQGLMNSGSKGGFLAQYIKAAGYSYQKIA